MTTHLRVGLIGVGRIAQLVHLRVLSRLPGVRLAAIAEPSPDRLRSAQALAPQAEAFVDYRELLSWSGIDAVVICLPTGMHAAAAVAAFAAGKHVYWRSRWQQPALRRRLCWRSGGRATGLG